LAFEKLPPGKHFLTRIVPYKFSETSTGWTTADKVAFEIRPGETTTLNLDDKEHTVTAHFQWPTGMQMQPGWTINASLHNGPIIPPEISTNRVARLAYTQTPEFRAAQENSHWYQPQLVGGNLFSASEVQPGNYTFSVSVYQEMGNNTPAKLIAHAEVPISVPDGQGSTSVDAGVIQLQPGK
jgi:hypothetical protein